MKIAHVIWAKYPVEAYGGTERVCYWLAKAQAQMGHDVTVLCKAGSSLPFAKVIEIPDTISSIDEFLPAGTEMVQLYGSPNFKISVPYLVNIGGNGQAGERFPTNTVFVSENHAQRHGWTEFVHNGIDMSEYPLTVGRGKHLLFMAKASWRVKNLKGALRVARATRRKIDIIGGRAACWHREAISHGLIGGEEKLRILREAYALLFPVVWNEPFGLAVVEAMACGVPVIATPRGGLPEIIDSRSGILCDSFDELVSAVEQVSKFAPESVRARVAEKFTHLQMAAKYETYYRKILSTGKIREGQPITPADANPQQKIYYRT